MRPAGYHKRAEQVWECSCSWNGRFAMASASSAALQHSHSEGRLGGSKRNPGVKEGRV